MCGIIGYLGPQEAMPIILDGLKRLEYRGYDSAGMAVIRPPGLAIRRSLGKLVELEKLLPRNRLARGRWASATPAGPPMADPRRPTPTPTRCGSVVVVHNGIIENYLELKEELIKARPPLRLGDGHGGRLPPRGQAPGGRVPITWRRCASP